jgi:hypothetical protein
VAHLSSQATQKAEIGRTEVLSGQPRQNNVYKTPSQWKKPGRVAHACHPSYRKKHKLEESQSRLALAKSKNLSPK